ncbi:hypothetical protein ACXR2U_19825, partial [Jatrophihabitans sp. YIM 134969]
ATTPRDPRQPAPDTGGTPAAAGAAGDTAVPHPPSGHQSPRAPLPSDQLAHALGLSPANNPGPTTRAADVPRTPRRSRPVAPRYRDPRSRRRLLVASAAAVVVLAGAGTAVGIAVSRGGSGGGGTSATATVPSAARAAASWLAGNVTTERRIVSPDAGLAADLNAAGVPADTVAGAGEARVGVVVVDRGAPDPAPSVASAGSARSLVLLALFTDGGDRVTVSQVVTGTAEEVQSGLDRAAETAASACRGLSANAAVTIASAAAPVFEAGALDLRAATLLAVIAQSQPVDVVAAPQDPAEAAAGRPVRTVIVKVQDEAEVREAASTARGAFTAEVDSPSASLDAPPGSLVLSWPTDAGSSLTLD